MISYFAHEGTEHATESESLSHMLKQDGLKIILITAIAAVLIYVTLKVVAGTSKPGKQSKKSEVKQEENEDE